MFVFIAKMLTLYTNQSVFQTSTNNQKCRCSY